ncbi:hypothetical protein F5B18DRAFT_646750 [Nemania serpens]|nr:hypothetical protein F5B18DRAFT_646750 [Nemania serpens]
MNPLTTLTPSERAILQEIMRLHTLQRSRSQAPPQTQKQAAVYDEPRTTRTHRRVRLHYFAAPLVVFVVSSSWCWWCWWQASYSNSRHRAPGPPHPSIVLAEPSSVGTVRSIGKLLLLALYRHTPYIAYLTFMTCLAVFSFFIIVVSESLRHETVSFAKGFAAGLLAALQPPWDDSTSAEARLGLLTPMDTPLLGGPGNTGLPAWAEVERARGRTRRDIYAPRPDIPYDHSGLEPGSLRAELRAWRRGAGWAVAGLAALAAAYLLLKMAPLRIPLTCRYFADEYSPFPCDAAGPHGAFKALSGDERAFLRSAAAMAPKPLRPGPYRIYSNGTRVPLETLLLRGAGVGTISTDISII